MHFYLIFGGQFCAKSGGHFHAESGGHFETKNSGHFRRNLQSDDKLKGKLVFLDTNGKGLIGIIIEERQLLGKRWAYIFSIRDSNGNLVLIDPKSYDPLSGEKSIFVSSSQLYLISLASLPKATQDSVKQSLIYSRFEDIVGLVTAGSTINQIKFQTLFDSIFLNVKGIGEGTIAETKIGNTEVLYQIIDAKTTEENLEFKDSHGLTIGTAQKLGRYSTTTNELSTVKWLPEIYSPLFLLNPQVVVYNPANFIGKLPGTNYGIAIKDPHELVTHNCAILGILGIGKSCLTFEILSKLLSSTGVKVFCIDLTNQYSRELKKYIDPNLIQEELPQPSRDHLRNNNPTGNSNNPSSWGNEGLYRTTVQTDFAAFIAGTKRVLILNPDIHIVSKPGSQFNIQHKVDLTPSEKTRIISEVLLTIARNNGETDKARYLMVLEEAHSLVPEWNSVANEGDKSSTNGIAKVILQGRKYGFGSMVIAQRTANISKSILNQCNTVFALRVFDDTGKQFLENYIGSEYSNLLPTLEERHAIAIGKALKLKQPLVIALNSKDDVMLPLAPVQPAQVQP
jgi:DNA helicase HerA-like ATPase